MPANTQAASIPNMLDCSAKTSLPIDTLITANVSLCDIREKAHGHQSPKLWERASNEYASEAMEKAPLLRAPVTTASVRPLPPTTAPIHNRGSRRGASFSFLSLFFISSLISIRTDPAIPVFRALCPPKETPCTAGEYPLVPPLDAGDACPIESWKAEAALADEITHATRHRRRKICIVHFFHFFLERYLSLLSLKLRACGFWLKCRAEPPHEPPAP